MPTVDLVLGIMTSKVGQTDPVFVVCSGFIGESVSARLQVCVQRLRFVSPWLTSRHTQTQMHTQTAF